MHACNSSPLHRVWNGVLCLALLSLGSQCVGARPLQRAMSFFAVLQESHPCFRCMFHLLHSLALYFLRLQPFIAAVQGKWTWHDRRLGLFVVGGSSHQVLGSGSCRHGGILRHDVSCVCQCREHCGGEHCISRLGRHAVSQSDAHCTCVHVSSSASSIDASFHLPSHPLRAHQVEGVARTRAAWPAASSARVDGDVADPPWRARAHVQQQHETSAEREGHEDAFPRFPYDATWKGKVTWVHVAGEGSPVVAVVKSKGSSWMNHEDLQNSWQELVELARSTCEAKTSMAQNTSQRAQWWRW